MTNKMALHEDIKILYAAAELCAYIAGTELHDAETRHDAIDTGEALRRFAEMGSKMGDSSLLDLANKAKSMPGTLGREAAINELQFRAERAEALIYKQ